MSEPETHTAVTAPDAEGFVPLPALLDAVKGRAIERLHEDLRQRGFPEIRPGHGCVFRFVGPDGMRLTELAEVNSMTKQAVGEIVDDLETLGLVERAPDPSDRRAKLILLTKRGAEAQSTARGIFKEIEQEWAERVGEERVAGLRALLGEMLDQG